MIIENRKRKGGTSSDRARRTGGKGGTNETMQKKQNEAEKKGERGTSKKKSKKQKVRHPRKKKKTKVLGTSFANTHISFRAEQAAWPSHQTREKEGPIVGAKNVSQGDGREKRRMRGRRTFLVGPKKPKGQARRRKKTKVGKKTRRSGGKIKNNWKRTTL